MSFASFNVLLTSYDFLRSDFQVLTPIEWQALIIDEGQKMKNNDSRFFKKCMCLHAQFKVLLSGTPLQNNIEELFNLMEFLDPVKFGAAFKRRMLELRTANLLSAQDSKKLNNPETAGQDEPKEAAMRDSQFLQEENFFKALQIALRPHLLRRFKREVLKNLPLRKEVIVRIEMTQEQKDMARMIIGKNVEALVALERGKLAPSLAAVNGIFTLLRLIVDHNLLLGSEYCTENFRGKKLCQ